MKAQFPDLLAYRPPPNYLTLEEALTEAGSELRHDAAREVFTPVEPETSWRSSTGTVTNAFGGPSVLRSYVTRVMAAVADRLMAPAVARTTTSTWFTVIEGRPGRATGCAHIGSRRAGDAPGNRNT